MQFVFEFLADVITGFMLSCSMLYYYDLDDVWTPLIFKKLFYRTDSKTGLEIKG